MLLFALFQNHKQQGSRARLWRFLLPFQRSCATQCARPGKAEHNPLMLWLGANAPCSADSPPRQHDRVRCRWSCLTQPADSADRSHSVWKCCGWWHRNRSGYTASGTSPVCRSFTHEATLLVMESSQPSWINILHGIAGYLIVMLSFQAVNNRRMRSPYWAPHIMDIWDQHGLFLDGLYSWEFPQNMWVLWGGEILLAYHCLLTYDWSFSTIFDSA